MAGAGPLRAAVGLAVASALLLALVVIPKSSGRVALEGAYAVSSADLLRVMDQADQEAARGMSPEDLPVRQISGLRKGGHLRQTEGNIGMQQTDWHLDQRASGTWTWDGLPADWVKCRSKARGFLQYAF
mmetsp:Transcript_49208/g.76827  ORF Transcript_49208/g.76827 Transcript_49208/m.76827 type:complete len:129 (+) Transcript_49208:92-478(+)